MKDLPPFYVRQKVIAIKDHSLKIFKKGDEFIIYQIRDGCCGWEVDIGLTTKGYNGLLCKKCGKEENTLIGWICAHCFAPIEQTFQSITFKEVIEVESPLIGIN